MNAEESVILYQCLIAFGQGTGAYRVSRKTCASIERYCLHYIQHSEKRVVEAWGQEDSGPQALERLRALGRLAAHLACGRGDTVVRPDDFAEACKKVHEANEKLRSQSTGTRAVAPSAVREHSSWCEGEKPPSG